MSSEILIAIIMAVASLLVAVVSLITSLMSNRQNARQLKELETLRFELANKQAAQKISDDYLLKDLEAVDAIIQAIQRLKDMLQLVLNARGENLDSVSTLEDITKIRQHIFERYEASLPGLKDSDARCAHRAKNQALVIETKLREYLHKTSYVSELSEKQKQAILDLRNSLTDSQDQLRDGKMTKLFQRLEPK